MAIPDYLLVHTVIRLRPAVAVDAYNNAILDYEDGITKEMQVWLQQDNRNMLTQDANARQGRYAADQRWLLISNDDDILWQDRIIFDGKTFVVYAQPEPTYTPNGYHHLEATLQIVDD